MLKEGELAFTYLQVVILHQEFVTIRRSWHGKSQCYSDVTEVHAHMALQYTTDLLVQRLGAWYKITKSCPGLLF
jgi:hypothetical protein